MNIYPKEDSLHKKISQTVCNHEIHNGIQASQNCFTCGALVQKNTYESYKSDNQKFQCLMNVKKCYQNYLKKRVDNIVIPQYSPYLLQRDQLIDLISDIASKLSLTQNTTHLAVMFLDYVISKGFINQNEYQLFAITSVMLGAKAIELDERIPFISKLRRYSNSFYKMEDFKEAEQKLLQCLNWNLQLTTNSELVEFYLAQGIIFSTDAIQDENISTKKFSDKENSENIKLELQLEKLSIKTKEIFLKDISKDKIDLIVANIEKDSQRLVNYVLKNTSIIFIDIKILSAACVGFLRLKSGIKSMWNNILLKTYNIEENEIMGIVQQLENTYDNKFINRTAQILNQENQLKERSANAHNIIPYSSQKKDHSSVKKIDSQSKDNNRLPIQPLNLQHKTRLFSNY